jgi:hypothetical protein
MTMILPAAIPANYGSARIVGMTATATTTIQIDIDFGPLANLSGSEYNSSANPSP